jgi:hypothetical protein
VKLFVPGLFSISSRGNRGFRISLKTALRFIFSTPLSIDTYLFILAFSAVGSSSDLIVCIEVQAPVSFENFIEPGW